MIEFVCFILRFFEVVEVTVAQLVVVNLLRMRGLIWWRLRVLLLVVMVVLVAPHHLWGGGALGLGSHVTGG